MGSNFPLTSISLNRCLDLSFFFFFFHVTDSQLTVAHILSSHFPFSPSDTGLPLLAFLFFLGYQHWQAWRARGEGLLGY